MQLYLNQGIYKNLKKFELYIAHIILFIPYFIMSMLCYVQIFTLSLLRSNTLGKHVFQEFEFFFKWFE